MKIFISYSHKDELLADKVAATLEEAGFDTWYGKHEIIPGENRGEKLAKGLNESDAMVVLLTPNAFESDSVRLDMDFALTDSTYNRRLIPVLVGEAKYLSAHNFPWILNHLKVIKIPEQGMNKEQLNQIVTALREVA